MKKQPYDFELPTLKEEFYDFTIDNIKDVFFDKEYGKNKDKYKNILNILYPENLTDEQKIKQFRESNNNSVIKKQLLLKILNNIDIDDFNKIAILKKCIPNGVHYGKICTDAEYENLKKEFN